MVNKTCYLLNQSPQASLDEKVAEEVFIGNLVDYNNENIWVSWFVAYMQ